MTPLQLRDLLTRHGLVTAGEVQLSVVAAKLGVDDSTVGKWARGQRRVSDASLRLLRGLKASPSCAPAVAAFWTAYDSSGSSAVAVTAPVTPPAPVTPSVTPHRAWRVPPAAGAVLAAAVVPLILVLGRAPEASATPPPWTTETWRARPPAQDLKSLGLENPDSPEVGEGVGWVLIRTVVVLGIVVGLVYLTLNFGLRRLMGVQAGSSKHQPLVSVVERIPLDPKRSMFVLKAAGEYLLVGGGEGALSLICKLDPAEVARIEGQRPAPTSTGISPFLQKLLSRRGGSP